MFSLHKVFSFSIFERIFISIYFHVYFINLSHFVATTKDTIFLQQCFLREHWPTPWINIPLVAFTININFKIWVLFNWLRFSIVFLHGIVVVRMLSCIAFMQFHDQICNLISLKINLFLNCDLIQSMHG